MYSPADRKEATNTELMLVATVMQPCEAAVHAPAKVKQAAKLTVIVIHETRDRLDSLSGCALVCRPQVLQLQLELDHALVVLTHKEDERRSDRGGGLQVLSSCIDYALIFGY